MLVKITYLSDLLPNTYFCGLSSSLYGALGNAYYLQCNVCIVCWFDYSDTQSPKININIFLYTNASIIFNCLSIRCMYFSQKRATVWSWPLNSMWESLRVVSSHNISIWVKCVGIILQFLCLTISVTAWRETSNSQEGGVGGLLCP